MAVEAFTSKEGLVFDTLEVLDEMAVNFQHSHICDGELSWNISVSAEPIEPELVMGEYRLDEDGRFVSLESERWHTERFEETEAK